MLVSLVVKATKSSLFVSQSSCLQVILPRPHEVLKKVKVIRPENVYEDVKVQQPVTRKRTVKVSRPVVKTKTVRVERPVPFTTAVNITVPEIREGKMEIQVPVTEEKAVEYEEPVTVIHKGLPSTRSYLRLILDPVAHYCTCTESARMRGFCMPGRLHLVDRPVPRPLLRPLECMQERRRVCSLQQAHMMV